MASTKPKVVSTVKRKDSGTARVAFPASAVAKVEKSLTAAKNAARKATAKAQRKAALAPLRKKKVAVAPAVPKVKREIPHVLKRDADKPLVERLTPKLLEQLRTRKVTNEAAAQALDVHPTYLSRVLTELGQEKTKGVTMAHREARAELVATRNKHRADLAKKVNRQEMTIEAAAKAANCSVRTMFRWCAEYANVKKKA